MAGLRAQPWPDLQLLQTTACPLVPFPPAGSYVTHETKHFIYFYLGPVAILLFKSG